MTQHDLPFGIAAETYVLLSIGDGLVAQIPSLLLAISTAIIVTRVSATHDMAENIGRQVNLSRAWIPVAGVLTLIGFVPGMPNLLFLIAAAIAAVQHRANELIQEFQNSVEVQVAGLQNPDFSAALRFRTLTTAEQIELSHAHAHRAG